MSLFEQFLPTGMLVLFLVLVLACPVLVPGSEFLLTFLLSDLLAVCMCVLYTCIWRVAAVLLLSYCCCIYLLTYLFTCSVLFQCVLHYMVRSKEAVGGVSREVVDILLHAGLIKK